MGWWSRMLGKKKSIAEPELARIPRPARPGQSPSPLPVHGLPGHACLARRGKLNALWASCPACSHSKTGPSDVPEWFAMLQAHVTAVQANDTAVRLFREDQLDDAIAELRRGLEGNPQHATGYSNLGFLYLRKGQLEQAVECLLHALEVDPQHQDAPDHLFDVLRALIDELVQIGLTDGFLSTRPGGRFDEYNRHMRAREIGHLLVKIGQQGVFQADGQVLEHDLLLGSVIKEVQKKMGHCSHSTTLKFAWQGIRGWSPPVAKPLVPSANAACLRAGRRL